MALCLYVLIPLSEMQWFLIIAITIYLGIITGTYVEKRLNKDPGIVVIDEMAGQWLSLLFLPRTFYIYIIAFLLFRLLDIIKPFPADRSQNLNGGLGIMMDDIIAGIYTNILIWSGWWIFA